MSRVVTIQWPVASTTAVALLQTAAAGAPLLINGTLANNGSVVLPSIERVITLTSAADLHLITFTITGLDGLGNPVSVTRAGPNANTVATTQKFNQVTSITPDLTVASNVSAGTGTTGSTIWFLSDYYRTNNSLACFVSVTATFNYTFQTTFDDPVVVASPLTLAPVDGVTVPTVPAATTMTSATTSVLVNYTIPTHSARINVNSSNATGAATIYFLQQGVR